MMSTYLAELLPAAVQPIPARLPAPRGRCVLPALPDRDRSAWRAGQPRTSAGAGRKARTALQNRRGKSWKVCRPSAPCAGAPPAEYVAVRDHPVAALILLPLVAGQYWNYTIGTVGIYVLLGLGLNIVVGLAGLLDLGYVAFFAIGAYTMALLTAPTPHHLMWNFWLVIPIAIFLAAVTGLLLGAPVLRMRGDYLAIVTLGFGEIIRILSQKRRSDRLHRRAERRARGGRPRPSSGCPSTTRSHSST